jgi:hypothetical protein
LLSSSLTVYVQRWRRSRAIENLTTPRALDTLGDVAELPSKDEQRACYEATCAKMAATMPLAADLVVAHLHGHPIDAERLNTALFILESANFRAAMGWPPLRGPWPR